VKDFFMDLKIPSEFRVRIPILISQGDPVWICGHRIDDRFKVTPETKRMLKVTVT
jgi:tRNA(Ile)-lysidine synthase